MQDQEDFEAREREREAERKAEAAREPARASRHGHVGWLFLGYPPCRECGMDAAPHAAAYFAQAAATAGPSNSQLMLQAMMPVEQRSMLGSAGLTDQENHSAFLHQVAVMSHPDAARNSLAADHARQSRERGSNASSSSSSSSSFSSSSRVDNRLQSRTAAEGGLANILRLWLDANSHRLDTFDPNDELSILRLCHGIVHSDQEYLRAAKGDTKCWRNPFYDEFTKGANGTWSQLNETDPRAVDVILQVMRKYPDAKREVEKQRENWKIDWEAEYKKKYP